MTDAAATNSPQTITVSLTVQAAPAIALDKTTLSPTVTVGQDAADGTFQVWNSGRRGDSTYTVADDAAWLSVDPDERKLDGQRRQALAHSELRHERPGRGHLHRPHQCD